MELILPIAVPALLSIVFYALWSSGLDNVATSNIEALSNGADIRVLKSEFKSMQVANKVVAQVADLDSKMTSKDALKALRKQSKAAKLA